MTPVARGRKNGRNGRRLPLVVIREQASKGKKISGFRIPSNGMFDFCFDGLNLHIWNKGAREIVVQPSGMVRYV